MFKNLIIVVLVVLLGVCGNALYNNFTKVSELEKQYNDQKAETDKEIYNLARMPEYKAKALYQLMKDTDMVMRKHNLEYWIEAGTLLGAERHKGLIPWDNDLDIQVSLADLGKLYSVSEDMKKLGYSVNDFEKSWIQIYYPDSNNEIQNHIDIYCMIFKGDDSAYANTTVQNAFNKLTFKRSEIYPLKEYKFGEVTVFGPNNPDRYLTEYFSKDYMTVGCIWPQHANSDVKQKRCFDLEADMLNPASPTGPLQDKSGLLNN